MKTFVVESIGHLIESVGNKKEEEQILRSFLVHYDGYFNNKAQTGRSSAAAHTSTSPEK